MINIDETTGILIIQEVGGSIVLHIMLAADGTIHRMGQNKAEHHANGTFIGRTDPRLFNELKSSLHPDMLSVFQHQIENWDIEGQPFNTKVICKTKDRKTGVESTYGGQYTWPSDVVTAFVTKAVQLTDPWYAEQHQVAETEKAAMKPWWKVW